MTCTGKRLILGVFLSFHYYVVYSEKLVQTQMVAPPLNDPAQGAIASGGAVVQQLSESTDYVGQIFYYQKTDTIMYANRKLNGSMISWSQNGAKVVYYFKELSNEVLTLIMPVKNNDMEFIIGSDLHLRLLTKNKTDYTLSEPIISFDDPGFIIHAAKCDENGVMFVLLVGKYWHNSHLGIMYKIINRKAIFVMQLNTSPRDFRFKKENDVMYLLSETSISEYPYNSSIAKFGLCTEVFNAKENLSLKDRKMTGIAIGRIAPPNLFVTTSGIDGYVVTIGLGNKGILRMTPVPSNDLTFITFGAKDVKRMLVGTKRTVGNYGPGAVYSIVGARGAGYADVPINW